jgi:hypothetical protein
MRSFGFMGIDEVVFVGPVFLRFRWMLYDMVEDNTRIP